jgi:hypothetical protein
MRALWLALAAALALGARGEPGAATGGVVEADFSNPGLNPAHWTLTIHPDGSGHFRSEMGNRPAGGTQEIEAPDVDREIRLSARFAESVFAAAQRHQWFNQECESHLKVAFQGWKQLSYSGPEGKGSCIFNYSKDKEIQELGDSLQAVVDTILEGVKLEMLLQHDRLGLDKEMEYLTQAAEDGRAQQIGAIRGILERLANDDTVMERVRNRARMLLARAGR